jgi:hypothetical protein
MHHITINVNVFLFSNDKDKLSLSLNSLFNILANNRYGVTS